MVPLVTGCPDGCRPCVWYSGGHNKRSTLWVWCAQQQTVTALYRAVPMPSHVPRTSKAVTTSTHHLCRHGSDTARFTRHQISLRPRLKPPFCNCRIWQRSVTCGHMSRRGNNALVETLATCPFDTDCQQMWHKSEESQTFLSSRTCCCVPTTPLSLTRVMCRQTLSFGISSERDHNDQTNIWELYSSKRVCQINHLWEQYSNYLHRQMYQLCGHNLQWCTAIK